MKILHCYSSKAEAARALNLSGEAIRKWCLHGVPPERVLEVCEKSGWKVIPHLLRRDIYPNATDAIPTDVLKKIDIAAICGDEEAA